MKIIQVTNIVCHLQTPIAKEIVSIVGPNNFSFVATERPSEDRKNIKWNTEDEDPWIIRSWENDKAKKELEKWWNEADVVLCGNRWPDRMEERVRQKKLTLYMSERWLKPPISIGRVLHPRFWKLVSGIKRLSKIPYFHYFAIGKYAASDMALLSFPKERIWLWGYFTHVPENAPPIEREPRNFRIFWAGRMLGWKRVDTLIRAFALLVKNEPDCHLTIAGAGPERNNLLNLADKLLDKSKYTFLPGLPVDEVWNLMRKSHVYVLPSSGYEGWGAVVNEAMTNGCAVIASRESGAAATLIEHEKNGLLFQSGNVKDLFDKLLLLKRNEVLRLEIGKRGQELLYKTWSPKEAARRFITFCDYCLSEKKEIHFSNGPLSRCMY